MLPLFRLIFGGMGIARVYVEDGSFKHYYVDIDAVLPNAVVH